jgi:serine protease inhibitor
MKTHKLSILLIFFLLTAVSCNEDVNTPVEINIDQKSRELIKADNAFGIDMFKLLAETEKDNFTISPLSISQALAMTYNGARSETKLAMEEALRKNGFTNEEINKSYQSLVNSLLNADNKVTLEFAQSIWYRLGFNVLPDFVSVNQTYYDAEVNELDFSKPNAKDIINGWIEDKTHDKIKDMIKSVEPDHVMFLINAIYFNGEWRSKFETKNTTKQTFSPSKGEEIIVDMMHKTETSQFFSNETFSALQLPYGNGNFSMVVLLPHEEKECSDILKILTPENWEIWLKSFYEADELSIKLPKFKDEYEVKLNKVLSTMGMEIAFTPMADFSGINGSPNLFIDYVQHNTFIDVSEKGTEAAAATVVAIKEFVAPVSPEFHVTRPFIFAITEKQTGAILFLGKMKKPLY